VQEDLHQNYATFRQQALEVVDVLIVILPDPLRLEFLEKALG